MFQCLFHVLTRVFFCAKSRYNMSLKDAFVAQNGIFFQSKAGEISVTSFLNFWFTGGATWWLYMAAMH